MEEKIVILGNGFDLRHFLPTKYNHLITILREIENYNFSDSNISFSDLFNGSFKEKDEFFYNGILDYYDVQNINFNSDELKSIQDRLKKNNWFQYLKTIEDFKIETWIDFETEINRLLKIIIENFSNISKNRFRSLQKADESYDFYFVNQEVKKFCSSKLELSILVLFNFFKIDENYSYFLNNNYLLAINNEIQYFKEKDFFNSIYYLLEDFIGIFNDYIEFIINRFYNNFKLEKEENFIKKNKYLFNNVVKIFSFNYTATYFNYYIEGYRDGEMFFINEEDIRKIEHTHGYSIKNWDGKLDNLKIVLGVDDIGESLKSNKLFQFTKYFQKLHKNTSYLFLDEIISTIEGGIKHIKYEFYFWGHSLDISDKDYIQDVFYVVNQTQSIIKIFYHSISGKADQLKNLLGIIDKNTIEDLMKKDRLIFIESTFENLYLELA